MLYYISSNSCNNAVIYFIFKKILCAAIFSIKIESHKVEWNAQPRIGSLDNASHKPGGGSKKVKLYASMSFNCT